MLDLLTQPNNNNNNNNNNKGSACSVSVESIQAHFLMWCPQKVSVPMYSTITGFHWTNNDFLFKEPSSTFLFTCQVVYKFHSGLHSFVTSSSSSSSSVICQTTGPKPLPKQFLHIVRSRASSFN